MLLIIGKVVSIFTIMLVGFIAYKVGVLGDDAVKPVTSILMDIACPCLIISSLYAREISDSMLSDTIAVMVGTMIFYIVSSLLTYLLVRTLKLGNKEETGVYIAAVAATNNGFMGFPIIKALYGGDMLYLMVMSNMILNVYLMWMEPSILTIGSGKKVSAKDLLNTLKSPLVISLAIGFVMMFAHIRPTGIVDETITMIGDITIPLSMILVGARLGSVRLREIVSRNNMIVSLFAMFVIPALVILAVHPISIIGADVKTILVIDAALPTAVFAAVIAEKYKKNSLLLSELVSLTTLMSVVTIPLAAIILEALK